ncbi:hypothetical protein Hdeb2414_s0026g00682991 [Helianthus debilis subsp. tardiflorus]
MPTKVLRVTTRKSPCDEGINLSFFCRLVTMIYCGLCNLITVMHLCCIRLLKLG